ncbi:MAG: SET domain-containing protein-lysine N-methyltransferase [Candidatus Cloacimonetes bacterium]|nr:SET domain-containing protein-lysine N-methyltransferase [Candidatus Cloacimonadota bacterium]
MKPVHKTWINPKIRICDSSIQGKGMFALSDIHEDETLIIWGDCYTDKAGAIIAQQQGKGIMQWDDDVFSYETSEKNDEYSINHSCDPNSWMSDAFTLIARRAIKSGDEITADYALWETNESFISSWNCNCGSELCRGQITGNDWKNIELQRRYEGHFSPLINKRISKIGSI